MAGKRSPTRAEPAEPRDPRFEELLRAFEREPQLAPIAKAFLAERDRGGVKKFGTNALKVNGKIFAMVARGHLVVKLAKSRVDDLVEKRLGEYFDPGHGRLMKQWVLIKSAEISWIELAKEAHQFVRKAR